MLLDNKTYWLGNKKGQKTIQQQINGVFNKPNPAIQPDYSSIPQSDWDAQKSRNAAKRQMVADNRARERAKGPIPTTGGLGKSLDYYGFA